MGAGNVSVFCCCCLLVAVFSFAPTPAAQEWRPTGYVLRFLGGLIPPPPFSLTFSPPLLRSPRLFFSQSYSLLSPRVSSSFRVASNVILFFFSSSCLNLFVNQSARDRPPGSRSLSKSALTRTARELAARARAPMTLLRSPVRVHREIESENFTRK